MLNISENTSEEPTLYGKSYPAKKHSTKKKKKNNSLLIINDIPKCSEEIVSRESSGVLVSSGLQIEMSSGKEEKILTVTIPSTPANNDDGLC